MVLDPLAFLILLGFAALLLLALGLWFVLTLGSGRIRSAVRAAPKPDPAPSERILLSNDDYRGAKASPSPAPRARQDRRGRQTDAFESFKRSNRDELDF